MGLLRLAALTGDERYRRAAGTSCALLGELAVQHPTAFGHLLVAVDLQRPGTTEVVVAGDRPDLVAGPRSRRTGRTSCWRGAAIPTTASKPSQARHPCSHAHPRTGQPAGLRTTIFADVRPGEHGVERLRRGLEPLEDVAPVPELALGDPPPWTPVISAKRPQESHEMKPSIRARREIRLR